MKKLLIIALVLLAATAVNAGLHLTVDGGSNPGEITLMPSDTITLGVSVDAGFGLGDFQISLSNAQGSLDASGVTFSQEYKAIVIPDVYTGYAPWDFRWASVGTLHCLCFPDPQHFSLGGGNLPPTVTIYDEIVMEGLIFHCDEPTDVIVSLEKFIGSGEFILLESLIVRQFPGPEPKCFTRYYAEGTPQYDLWVSLGEPECWCSDIHQCGDVNGDCYVTITEDIMPIVTARAGGAATYNPCADANYDGLVTITNDIMTAINHRAGTAGHALHGYDCIDGTCPTAVGIETDGVCDAAADGDGEWILDGNDD